MYTGLGERYIRRLRSERKIPCVRIGGRLLFDPDDLDDLIEQHRQPAVDLEDDLSTDPSPDHRRSVS
jgi:excisionase family DNA binding protein